MKLIRCINCLDWVKLTDKRKWCECRRVSGLYINREDIYINGPCMPFGVNNLSWQYAMDAHLATFEGWFYHTGYIQTDTIYREDHTRYDSNKVRRLEYRLSRAKRYVETLEREAEDRKAVGESE